MCIRDRRSLVLRCKTGISRIELDRLLYCEVLGRTLLFHLSDGGVLESTCLLYTSRCVLGVA